MHNIISTLYDMCINNVSINLKSLLNTFYNDKDIKISEYEINDIEDLYDCMENNECYNWYLGLDLYTECFHPTYTPYVYRYSYLCLDVYDKQYNDWFELHIYFSKEDTMVIGNYNDNYDKILHSQKININDDIRIISIIYNHSIEIDMNIHDPENMKFIREGSKLFPHLPELKDFYDNKIIEMTKLLKEFQQNEIKL